MHWTHQAPPAYGAAMFDLERFVADCRAALGEAAPGAAVREVVARAVAEPAGVERVLGTPARGGIYALHHSPELTIFNIVWTPGMAVQPHDHRMWAVIGLYGGREDNTFYRRSPAGLAVAGTRQLEGQDTVVLGRDVIHTVANPLRTFTGALHVYGGDFVTAPRSQWTPDTFEEQPFDLAQGRRVFAEANERWRQDTRRASQEDLS
jgi:predicted metal-dependent enzyme (double-stranded beta helix superfamily)